MRHLLGQHGDLLDQLGRPELALAGYNAGGGRARRWWRAIADDDVPLFVESIPIEETRNYVKAVTWNRWLYAAAWLGGAGSESEHRSWSADEDAQPGIALQ